MKFKAENNSHEPLTESASEHLQARVDDIHAMFIQSVARARGVDAAKASVQFGQGRSFLAEQALAAWLIDRIATFESVVADLSHADDGEQVEERYRPVMAACEGAYDAGHSRFQPISELIGH